MKKIISLLSLCIVLFFLINLPISANAQTPSTTPNNIATKYNITFPIAELGNCTDVTSCKEYCEDTTHQEACVGYAKSKGFYKEPSGASILQDAKTTLGCDSRESCETLCSKEENQQKCSDFAKEHNLAGGSSKDPGSNSTLEKAKEVLGCDSKNSCKEFCSKEENQQKCSDFAKENGLRGGAQKVGPGGCATQDSCRSYCGDANHITECQQFRSNIATSSARPSGFEPKLPLSITPNPSLHPSPIYENYPSYTPPPNYTNTNNTSTIPTGTPPTSPTIAYYASYCSSHPGCTWTDNHCVCQTTLTTTPTSIPPNSPTIAYYEQYCNSHPTCTWTNNQCKCATPTPTPSVKGEATHRSFLEILLDFISRGN